MADSSQTQDVPELLQALMRHLPHGGHVGSILAVRRLPGRDARFADLPSSMHPRLAEALRHNRGIERLYLHQRMSWDAVEAGRDIVVVTPTASGKTMCFNLPVLSAAMHHQAVRAMYFYPTKALANDQLAALRDLIDGVDGAPTAAVYHGDLAEPERTAILANPPNILLATPDIVHFQQLPKHLEWRRWWSALRFIVVDEAHAYRGVFGSHIAHLLRRVERIADLYGSHPQFITASATIGNPTQHVAGLIGREPVLIDQDGSPQAARDVAIWEPIVYDRAGQPVAPESAERETARLLVASVLAGNSTIVFARSRRWVERIGRRAVRELRREGSDDLAGRVVAYRSGFSRERRMEIERGLRTGDIRGVVATNALELGVDIGSLDVAILASYPGSTMSFRQQAGRAGRRGRPALVVMVASQNPLDRYIAEHPDVLIDLPAENAAIDPANLRIADGQLGLAARERRLVREDEALYGASFTELVRGMSRRGKLIELRSGWEATGRGPRPIDVPLRTIDNRSYTLLAHGVPLGDLDARVAAREGHPGAIYLHDGQAYRVRGVDAEGRTIALEASDDGVYTEPLGDRFIDLLGMSSRRTIAGNRIALTLGDLRVTSTVTGYREIDEDTGKQRGSPFEIEAMRSVLTTRGIQLAADSGVDPAAIHAIEHLLRSLAPLTVLCDRADLDGHTTIDGVPVLAYIFDIHDGGVGLSERLYERIDEVLIAAAERVNTCDCLEGCPRCTHDASCLLRNEGLSKSGAAALLGDPGRLSRFE